MNPKNILITGASGLIGTRLTTMLKERGHHVAHLSRSRSSREQIKTYTWDIRHKKLDRNALAGADTIIHLAGANVGDKRWSALRKKEILESRTQSTALLVEKLSEGGHAVKNFISASAIGYYGFANASETYTETSSAGRDFLASVVKAWEAEADVVRTLDIRLVKIRIGVVLSEHGGALKEIARPVKYLVGAPLGNGQQFISWIHLDDVCRLFVKACEDKSMQGAYNAVAPYPVTNLELTRAIAKALHKPLILPSIPKFLLKMVLGEMADLVLYGSKVSSRKTEETGFQFLFPTLDQAVAHLLLKSK